MKNNKEILKVENVSKYFGGIHALEGVRYDRNGRKYSRDNWP